MERIEFLQLCVDSGMSGQAIKDCGVHPNNSDAVNIANLRSNAARYRKAQETNGQRAFAFENLADWMLANGEEANNEHK